MSLLRITLLLAAEMALAAVVLLALLDDAHAAGPAYRAVALVCPADLPAPACDRATARDVLATVSVPTPFACMMGSLMTAARAPELVSEGYVKIVCEGGR